MPQKQYPKHLEDACSTVNFQYIFKQTEGVCKCNLLMKNHLAVLLRMNCCEYCRRLLNFETTFI